MTASVPVDRAGDARVRTRLPLPFPAPAAPVHPDRRPGARRAASGG